MFFIKAVIYKSLSKLTLFFISIVIFTINLKNNMITSIIDSQPL